MATYTTTVVIRPESSRPYTSLLNNGGLLCHYLLPDPTPKDGEPGLYRLTLTKISGVGSEIDLSKQMDSDRQALMDSQGPPSLTIADFLDYIGISPLHTALRAIDKYNLEHVWLVLADGTRLYYHTEGLNSYDPDTPVAAVGAGCIAWDGSDWEYSTEQPYTGPDSIDAVRQDCEDAYTEYRVENPYDTTTTTTEKSP
jgi:hypothetical protein